MNDILPQIETALTTESTSAILHFGVYRITEHLGGGGQGRVYKVEHPVGKAFALKLYHPTPEEAMTDQENWENFRRETRILASLSHKNVVGIITAGVASIDANKYWKLSEGLPDTKPTVGDQFFFYVMDFVPVRAKDVFPILDKRWQPRSPMVAAPYLVSRVRLFEKLVRDISEAIGHCHSQPDPLTHKDIKGDNILLRTEDETFVLADFGFARHLNSVDQDRVIRRLETANPALIHAGEYKANDLFEFATVILKLLPAFEQYYEQKQYQSIESVFRAVIDSPKDRRHTAATIRAAVEPYFTQPGWDLRLKIGGSLVPNEGKGFVFNSKIRIPVSGSVLLTESVRKIIDSADFQRLRGVRQLGPTYFVFPGAFHTRFEHSLGAYHLILRYFETLTRIPEFNAACEPLEETIKTGVLAALLHDIGHYPYSHWVEEVESFPNCPKFESHEERGASIILNGEIGKLISDWGILPERVTAVITDLPGDRIQSAVESIVSSVLDVDKLDYLVRDSIHCGIPYGAGLDVDRLVEALHYDSEFQRVCLNTKGRSHLLSLLACRDTMYQEVFWHKTVRSCTGMFKRFIYHALERQLVDYDALQALFDDSDDVFVWKLYERAASDESKGGDLVRLIKPLAFKSRDLYKAAYTFNAGSGFETPSAHKFFSRVLNGTYQSWISCIEKLHSELKTHIPSLTPLDIVLEASPLKSAQLYDIARLRLWNVRRRRIESLPEGLKPLNEYLEHNRQAYLFCRKEYYGRLSALSSDEWDVVFNAASK